MTREEIEQLVQLLGRWIGAGGCTDEEALRAAIRVQARLTAQLLRIDTAAKGSPP